MTWVVGVNGIREVLVGSMGDWTAVASANRGVLGVRSAAAIVDESSDDAEEARGLVVILATFFGFWSIALGKQAFK